MNEAMMVSASEYETREEIVSNAITLAKKEYGLSDEVSIVSVGDGVWDLKTAQVLGLDFIGIGEGKKAEALRSLGARVAKDFSDRSLFF
jgi:phosphoglycolate phosphatase-like HAD superfamily hydrolase